MVNQDVDRWADELLNYLLAASQDSTRWPVLSLNEIESIIKLFFKKLEQPFIVFNAGICEFNLFISNLMALSSSTINMDFQVMCYDSIHSPCFFISSYIASGARSISPGHVTTP